MNNNSSFIYFQEEIVDVKVKVFISTNMVQSFRDRLKLV